MQTNKEWKKQWYAWFWVNLFLVEYLQTNLLFERRCNVANDVPLNCKQCCNPYTLPFNIKMILFEKYDISKNITFYDIFLLLNAKFVSLLWIVIITIILPFIKKWLKRSMYSKMISSIVTYCVASSPTIFWQLEVNVLH